jgi:hypothetical protein
VKTADSTFRALRAEEVARFFEAALPKFPDGRKVTVVGIYDMDFPESLWQGISSVSDVILLSYDLREGDPSKHLEEIWSTQAGYFSFHDFCDVLGRPASRLVKSWAKSGKADYTSYEFPRLELEPWQAETVLAGHFAGDPRHQRKIADRFFSLLAGHGSYEVEVLTGPAGDQRRLVVSGKRPWMELCGPNIVGDVRFAPGCELFWNGVDVTGDFHCAGALNLLPLGNEFDETPYRRLLDFGRAIGNEPLDLHVETGRLTGIDSDGQLAGGFKEVFATDVAYSHVVEVGIGLSSAALPLITSWASPTNEAVSGVHVGFGADPANIDRFGTRIHMDFVTPEVSVNVNDQPFYQHGEFLLDSATT